MNDVLVATGLTREARCLRGIAGVTAIAGGGDVAALRRRLELAVADGARGIASFGMAGALADGLAPGDWVIGDRLSGVIDLPCDAAWRDALAATTPGARIGGVFADGHMIVTVAQKLALGARHHALAVDMESHVAGAVAAAHGLPFAIVRCVSDGARHPLPPAIAVAMRPDGGLNIGAMLASIARRPSQLAELARMSSGFVRAMRELKRGARVLGDTLARA